MKTVQINLISCDLKSLKKLSEATKGNMTNVSIAGEFIEFEQLKLSALLQARFGSARSAIDKAYAQLG